MDTRQLAAFCAVIDRASFSQAAEQLGVTQPAVSLAVRSLERRLGATLIDRSARHAEPTEAGRLVYRHAQRILAAELELTQGLAASEGEPSGHLVLAASAGPGERFMPALLVGFRDRYPAVTVALRVDASDAVIERVLDRHVEIGIVGVERPHRSLVYEPFIRDELVLCLPAGHRMAGQAIPVDVLRSLPLVVQQEGSGVRAVVERELRNVGVRARDLDVIAELGLSESCKAAVLAGVGAAFISRGAVEAELADGRIVTATVEGFRTDRTIFAVRLSSRPPSRLGQSFLEYAREQLGSRAIGEREPTEGPVRGGRVG
jgi:DNA-binding transcriptional LysR family regulator